MQSSDKISAIYDLRDAVEKKVRAEVAVDATPGSAEARDVLLDSTLEVEAKTQHAIEVCHACGGHHEHDAEHTGTDGEATHGSNVVDVDFRGRNGHGHV